MDNIYFQTIILSIKKDDKPAEDYAFIGLSAFTKNEWDKLLKEDKKITDVLSETDAIKLGVPVPIEKAITNPEHKDLVDMIRDELMNKNNIS